jgi:hypothetical protein
MKTALLLLIFAIVSATAFPTSLPAAEEYTYWIEGCPGSDPHITGCEPGDVELARWALEAWQRESGGAIVFKKVLNEVSARIRVHWATGGSSLYGETEPMMFEGKRGAIVNVLPSVVTDKTDLLLRDAIVYLTCLHESGHALGLQHTRAFADIMYSFQYGGDITAYFGRYRGRLRTRADIPAHSGVSDADRAALRAVLSVSLRP